MTLADRVTEQRIKLNITKAQLANKTGLTRGYISNLERGVTNNPNLDTIRSLCAAFNTTADYLLFGTKHIVIYANNEETVAQGNTVKATKNFYSTKQKALEALESSVTFHSKVLVGAKVRPQDSTSTIIKYDNGIWKGYVTAHKLNVE